MYYDSRSPHTVGAVGRAGLELVERREVSRTVSRLGYRLVSVEEIFLLNIYG
jgi:hypothetical protein